MWAALRRGRVRWLVGSLAVIAGVATYFVVFGDGGLNDCEAAVRSSTPAPGGKMSAVVFEMECGATVSFNTQVSLAPADRPFSPRKTPAFLVLSGQHVLVVRWVGEKSLEVAVPQGAQVFRNEPSVEGITVKYR